ncbi:DUF3426 domain-containing protein [Aliamphritea hakodatensis]|uniref:DUF3426 domain-containing protein n=1 Tax=Aliamphritea hakodatensis TaxID=2895352 RepID=UPI0022FD41F1|nr:DUF3426 domain-containing protein [Aliamphritea hakodatensis]
MKQQRLITACPACKARFQVTAGQLKIAHGKVRCGTCLEVFNAELCKVPEPKPAKTPEPATQSSVVAPAQEKPSSRPAIPKAFIPARKPVQPETPQPLDLDQPVQALFNSSPKKVTTDSSGQKEAATPEQPLATATTPVSELPVSLHIRQAKSVQPQPDTPANNDRASPAEQNHSQPPGPERKQQSASTQQEGKQPSQPEPSGKTATAGVQDSPQQTHAAPLKDTRSADESAQTEKIRQALHRHQTSYQARDQEHGYLNPAEKKLQELLRNASNPLTATDPAPAPQPVTASAPVEHSSILALHPDTEDKDSDFVPQQTEPVMIRATHQPPGKTLSQALIIFLALSCLLLQFMWFERNDLIRQPALTKLYKPVCEQIDCRLAVPENVPDIITEQLIVQEHKDYQGVITISMLLRNKAAFEQAFPAIRLAFSDRNGSIINRRTFQPAEYLNSVSLDASGMPLEHSIQVHLDVLNPGRAAVGYEVSLHPSSLTNRRL